MRTLFICIAFVFIAASCQADDISRFLESRTLIGQVYFAEGSSRLSIDQQKMLADLTKALQRHNQTGRLVRVEGFASPEGEATANYDLSLHRSLAVKDYLQKQGLMAQLFLTGYGENTPTAAKLAKQRRVDVVIYKVNPAVMQLFHGTGRAERYMVR